MTTALAEPVFTAHDRCDRCGAQAKALVTLHAGHLLFCGHHATAYAAALEVQALAVQAVAHH